MQFKELNPFHSFRDLGLFAMIGAKRRKLERLLEQRPRIHSTVMRVSSITGDVRTFSFSSN